MKKCQEYYFNNLASSISTPYWKIRHNLFSAISDPLEVFEIKQGKNITMEIYSTFFAFGKRAKKERILLLNGFSSRWGISSINGIVRWDQEDGSSFQVGVKVGHNNRAKNHKVTTWIEFIVLLSDKKTKKTTLIEPKGISNSQLLFIWRFSLKNSRIRLRIIFSWRIIQGCLYFLSYQYRTHFWWYCFILWSVCLCDIPLKPAKGSKMVLMQNFASKL